MVVKERTNGKEVIMTVQLRHLSERGLKLNSPPKGVNRKRCLMDFPFFKYSEKQYILSNIKNL